jgi:hypothetical protein
LTGFECFHEDAANLLRNNPDIKLDHDWKYCLAFVWLGSKWKELLAAWMAGTAYAVTTDGIIYDAEQEKFVTPENARRIVYELEHPSPTREAAMNEVRREFGFDPWPKVGKQEWRLGRDADRRRGKIRRGRIVKMNPAIRESSTTVALIGRTKSLTDQSVDQRSSAASTQGIK